MSWSKASRDAAYWRNAYETLVKQTGRDLNDGLGTDPRVTYGANNVRRIIYRGWIILSPTWEFCHRDWGGGLDARCGKANSLDSAKAAVDRIIGVRESDAAP